MMLDSTVMGPGIGGQLLAIASDPELRQSVYERLGEYCHQCRNRLNSLKLSLYLARREALGSVRISWETLEAHYLELEHLIERIQVICRPMSLSLVTLGLDLLIDDRRPEWSRLVSERGGELLIDPPPTRAVAAFDVDRMGAALDALTAWRAKVFAPGTTARVRWQVESGRASLAWEEDRPRSKFQLKPDLRPGRDGDWTLPLVARVVAAHGGVLSVIELDGWRLDLSWPAGP